MSCGNDCQLLTIQNIPIRRSMGLFTPNTANKCNGAVCNRGYPNIQFLAYDLTFRPSKTPPSIIFDFCMCSVWCVGAETRDRGVHIRISVGLTQYVEILLRGVTDAAEGSIPLNHTVKNTVLQYDSTQCPLLIYMMRDGLQCSVGSQYDGQPYLATLYQIRA